MSDEESTAKKVLGLDAWGDALVQAAEHQQDRRKVWSRWRPRTRVALVPLAALALAGTAGVAIAELNDASEPIYPQGEVVTSYGDAVFGRNCPEQQIQARLPLSGEETNFSSVQVRCGDGSDPGLGEQELAEAKADAIDRIGIEGLPTVLSEPAPPPLINGSSPPSEISPTGPAREDLP